MGLFFVIGGLTLSALSYISPILAAMLHVAGSLLVVFNSFRLVRQGEELVPHRPSAIPAKKAQAEQPARATPELAESLR